MKKIYIACIFIFVIFSCCSNYFGAGKAESSNRLHVQGIPFTNSRESFKQTISENDTSRKVIFLGPKTTFVYVTKHRSKFEILKGQEVYAKGKDNFWYIVDFFSEHKGMNVIGIERPKRDFILLTVFNGKDKIKYTYLFREDQKFCQSFWVKT
jgi:hypothetical protein